MIRVSGVDPPAAPDAAEKNVRPGSEPDMADQLPPAAASSDPKTVAADLPTPDKSAGMKAALTGNLADRAQATQKFKDTAKGHADQVAAVTALIVKKNERVAAAADRLAEGDAAANAIAEALIEGSKRLAAFEEYMEDQRAFMESIAEGDDDAEHDDEEKHAALDILPSAPAADK